MGLSSLLPQPIYTQLIALRNRSRQRKQARELSQIAGKSSKKIVIGSAGTSFPGWVSTDYPLINLLDEKTWAAFIQPGSLDAIMAEHVWEHLTSQDAITAAKTCFKFLKPGGYLRVAVPDGFHPDKDYIDQVKPGGTGAGADDHKVLYTHDSFSQVFARAGFNIDLYEFFDAKGNFTFREWDPAGGMISRSKRFDKRNMAKLAYTSIIMDAKKPHA
jgi:predicted SAM-dependent methyltransferase